MTKLIMGTQLPESFIESELATDVAIELLPQLPTSLLQALQKQLLVTKTAAIVASKHDIPYDVHTPNGVPEDVPKSYKVSRNDMANYAIACNEIGVRLNLD